MTANLDHIGENLGCDQRGTCPRVLEESVGRNRGAVQKAIGRPSTHLNGPGNHTFAPIECDGYLAGGDPSAIPHHGSMKIPPTSTPRMRLAVTTIRSAPTRRQICR